MFFKTINDKIKKKKLTRNGKKIDLIIFQLQVENWGVVDLKINIQSNFFIFFLENFD